MTSHHIASRRAASRCWEDGLLWKGVPEERHMRTSGLQLSSATIAPAGTCHFLHLGRKSPPSSPPELPIKAVHDKSPNLNEERDSGGVVVRLLASHLGERGSISDGVARRYFRMRESYRTMPLVGGFSRGSPVSPALSFRGAVPYSPRFTLILRKQGSGPAENRARSLDDSAHDRPLKEVAVAQTDTIALRVVWVCREVNGRPLPSLRLPCWYSNVPSPFVTELMTHPVYKVMWDYALCKLIILKQIIWGLLGNQREQSHSTTSLTRVLLASPWLKPAPIEDSQNCVYEMMDGLSFVWPELAVRACASEAASEASCSGALAGCHYSAREPISVRLARARPAHTCWRRHSRRKQHATIQKRNCSFYCELHRRRRGTADWEPVRGRLRGQARASHALGRRRRCGAAPECKGGGKTGDPEETRLPAVSSGTITNCENPGETRPGIEPSLQSTAVPVVLVYLCRLIIVLLVLAIQDSPTVLCVVHDWPTVDQWSRALTVHQLMCRYRVLCMLETYVSVHWLLPRRVARVTPHLAACDSLFVSLQVCYWLRGAHGVFSKKRGSDKGDTATRIKGAIAGMRRAVEWLAGSVLVVLHVSWGFQALSFH
ncbi:hypothetical protein PR048_022965 [Dryococelus australis]|uniref:Uncharacterized protein n=1 Tax=Dryococelus australis TaxID=614101 RepID=A0ABQ9GSR7_9NEOP|nr:hypothetical protein PR048_022965 [Dryococelus australis]